MVDGGGSWFDFGCWIFFILALADLNRRDTPEVVNT
jgi:hypothetical protein